MDWPRDKLFCSLHPLRSIALMLTVGCLATHAGHAFPAPGAAAPPSRAALRSQWQTMTDTMPDRPPSDDSLRQVWSQGQLHLRKARILLENYYPGAWSEDKAAQELTLAETAFTSYRLLDASLRLIAVAQSLPRGPDLAFARRAIRNVLAPNPGPGFFETAYWCDLDGSAQPYIGYIPTAYDGHSEYPLLVYLHGYSPFLDIVNWSELSPDLLDIAETGDFLVVAPFARGNTDFQGIGERDVMHVIDRMQQRYSVDADRILLVGYSMGGMGAWTLAAHYPHRFAGALIVSGRACYYTWHDVTRDDLPFYKQAFVDMEFGHSLLPNLKNIPVLCYHGKDDALVPIHEARTMAQALEPRNPDFQYREIEGREHWIFDDVMRKPETRRWLIAQRRRRPETFQYVTWHPRYRQAYWLSLSADAPAGQRREVGVTRQADHWLVHAENADTVWLHPDQLPPSITAADIKAAQGLTLKTVSVARASQVSYATDPVRPPRGPLKEFFLSPFIFVQAGDSKHPETAKRFSNRCREWEQYAQAAPRRLRETALDAETRRDYNLFLFGEPESSPMIREVLTRAPIDITPREYRVGDYTVPRDGRGLLLVYQSPWHPDRLVAVQCGPPWGRHLSVNHRYDYVPEFVVYDTQPDPDGSNRAWIAGFFDAHRRVETDTLYIRQDILETRQDEDPP